MVELRRDRGEADIAGGARTDKAAAKFESESPQQSGLRRWFKAGSCCHRPASSMARSADGQRSPAQPISLKRNRQAQARPTSRAARERITPMQNLRARVRTRAPPRPPAPAIAIANNRIGDPAA